MGAWAERYFGYKIYGYPAIGYSWTHGQESSTTRFQTIQEAKDDILWKIDNEDSSE